MIKYFTSMVVGLVLIGGSLAAWRFWNVPGDAATPIGVLGAFIIWWAQDGYNEKG